jgi:transposase, IS5 family
VFRAISGPVSSWELLLRPELLRVPGSWRGWTRCWMTRRSSPVRGLLPPGAGPAVHADRVLSAADVLKFRYRLGYESLCAEVSDSISWRRFCRIGLDGRVPHPATLMKLTSRCGEAAVAGLNEALWAKAAGQELLRTGRVRADTTVIPANVAFPADARLLARAVAKLVRAALRVQAAGRATGTVMTGRRRAAIRRAREMAATMRARAQLGRGEVSAAAGRMTADLAGLAKGLQCRRPRCCATAAARSGVPSPGGCAGGCGGRWASWRWPSAGPRWWWPRPGPGWPGRCRTVRPGWSACTTPMPGRSARAASTSRPGSGYKAQVLDNDEGIVLDYAIECGVVPDGPQLAPAITRVTRRAGRVPGTVTADRGYGQAAVERDLHAAGVRTVAIPRQATTLPGPQGRCRRAWPRLPC